MSTGLVGGATVGGGVHIKTVTKLNSELGCEQVITFAFNNNPRYIITWVLHQIFMYSNKVILAIG